MIVTASAQFCPIVINATEPMRRAWQPFTGETADFNALTGAYKTMSEDTATGIGLVRTGIADPTLSPSAIAALLLEIQSSLLETPEHAHLSEAAEDLLLALVRSIKVADAARSSDGATPSVPASGEAGKPQLRIVKAG